MHARIHPRFDLFSRWSSKIYRRRLIAAPVLFSSIFSFSWGGFILCDWFVAAAAGWAVFLLYYIGCDKDETGKRFEFRLGWLINRCLDFNWWLMAELMANIFNFVLGIFNGIHAVISAYVGVAFYQRVFPDRAMSKLVLCHDVTRLIIMIIN